MRAQLPFEVIKDGQRIPVIRYWGQSTTGKKLPIDIFIEEGPYAQPLGKRILEVVELYRLKEGEVDGLLKQIEDLEVEKRRLEGVINSLQHQVAQAKSKNGKAKDE